MRLPWIEITISSMCQVLVGFGRSGVVTGTVFTCQGQQWGLRASRNFNALASAERAADDPKTPFTC
jgi:hypothetical protein